MCPLVSCLGGVAESWLKLVHKQHDLSPAKKKTRTHTQNTQTDINEPKYRGGSKMLRARKKLELSGENRA